MSYTPDRKDIMKLESPDAERLLQEILWSCADRMGVSKAFVNRIESTTISRRPNQNVKDGGLELTVRLPNSVTLQDPFKNHSMIVQVKSGKKLLSTNEIENEVTKEKVKAFLANGGHYVIAYKGVVPTYGEHDIKWDSQNDKLRSVIDKHYPSGNVTGAIWTPDEIERLTKDAPQSWSVFASGNIFATLCSQTLKNLIDKNIFEDYGFDIPFVLGGPREDQLEELKNWVKDFNGFFELRGNMGVGKSRLAFEAVKATDRDGTTIWHVSRPESSFINTCHSFLSSRPIAHLRMVVDECDDDMAERLKSLAQLYKQRVSLLAIIPFKSRDATTRQSNEIRVVNKMTKDDLQRVIATFHLEDEVVDWIIHICDGYPKLARILAEKAQYETGRMSKENLVLWLSEHTEFRDPTMTTRGWVNLILDQDDQAVLRVLALLTEVGFQGQRKDEYQKLCDFFQLDQDKVEKVIKKNLAKGLLASGSDYIYVTPLILASYLCADRLSTIRDQKFEELGNLLHHFPRPQFSGTALESLTEQIKMSALTGEVQKILFNLLKRFRPFDKAILQSEVVAELAFACSHFQPQYLLKSFASDLGKRSFLDVKTWKDGRRKTVRFLESAAFYPELFDDAMDGLFLLSKAENETWANNASSLWAGFFSADLSGSMAPFSARVAWLIRLIESGDDSHNLIEKAIESVVSSNTGRMTGHENQLGLPQIEIKYELKLSDFCDSLNQLICVIRTEDYRINRLAKVFVDNLRGLVKVGYVQKNIDFVRWLKKLSDSDISLQQRLLIASDHILEWESKLLGSEAKLFFENIRHDLDVGNLESRVRRWSFDPLLKDYEIEKEEPTSLEHLVEELVQKPDDLVRVGAILTDPSASRSWHFAFKIGELDKGKNCWSIFDRWLDKKKAQELKTRYLVGRSHGGESPDWIDDRLDELIQIENIDAIVNASKDVETDRSLNRLLSLASMAPEYVSLLVYGGRASRLSEKQLGQVVDFFRMLKNEVNLSPLWDVLGQYLHGRKDGPLPLGKPQIEYLISSLHAPTIGTMTDFYQDLIVKIILSHHLNETIATRLAKDCLDVIVDERSDFRRSKVASKLLKSIAEKWSDLVFKVVLERLETDDGLALYKIEHAMNAWAHSIFSSALENTSKYCDEKIGEKIVRLVPESYSALNITSATLMKRFPTNNRISDAVARSFFSGVFSGPITSRLEGQISALDSWATQHGIEKHISIRRLRDSLSSELDDQLRLEKEEDFLSKKDR